MISKYHNSECLLNEGSLIDAWIKNRRLNYSSIEGHYPLFGEKAKGCRVWDVDGNEYIDYTMGYGTIILGHADDRVNQAVFKEICQGTCLSPMWKTSQLNLAKTIHDVIPNAENVFFMKTGSDATSGAVRLARCFTNKNMVLRWGYNGWHDWATPRPLGVPEYIQCDIKQFDYNSLDRLEELFKTYKNQISCVIMMPFQTEYPQPVYLSSVMEIAHNNNALFILDEMRSGFRMSLGGAQEYFNIIPDLATYSKAMANGYPISAITGRADVLSYINQTKMTATYFTSSYEMEAAIKTIEIIKTTNVLQSIWSLGEKLKSGLSELVKLYHIRARVVGFPPMPFIEFNYGVNNEKAKALFYSYCAEHGVLFHPNHHWYISGSHSIEDIMNTLNVCESAFNNLKYLEG